MSDDCRNETKQDYRSPNLNPDRRKAGMRVRHYDRMMPFIEKLTDPVDLLTARGFLFEYIGGKDYRYVFEESECRYNERCRFSDYDDMIELCERFMLGSFETESGTLTITDRNIDISELRGTLFCSKMYPFPVTEYEYYTNNTVSVLELEPYIARYVKTLNACMIPTEYSCDNYNNHNNGEHAIVVRATGEVGKIFHQWVVEHYISAHIRLGWSSDWTMIQSSSRRQEEDYYNLQLASEILFENRSEIRNKLKESLEELRREGYNPYCPSDEAAAIYKKILNLA